MKSNNWYYLEHMLQACEDIIEFLKDCSSAEEFAASKMLRSATTMELLNLGELIKKSSELGNIDGKHEMWQSLIRFRDRTAHWYHTTDFITVYTIAKMRIPKIYMYLQQQLNSSNN